MVRKGIFIMICLLVASPLAYSIGPGGEVVVATGNKVVRLDNNLGYINEFDLGRIVNVVQVGEIFSAYAGPEIVAGDGAVGSTTGGAVSVLDGNLDASRSWFVDMPNIDIVITDAVSSNSGNEIVRVGNVYDINGVITASWANYLIPVDGNAMVDYNGINFGVNFTAVAAGELYTNSPGPEVVAVSRSGWRYVLPQDSLDPNLVSRLDGAPPFTDVAVADTASLHSGNEIIAALEFPGTRASLEVQDNTYAFLYYQSQLCGWAGGGYISEIAIGDLDGDGNLEILATAVANEPNLAGRYGELLVFDAEYPMGFARPVIAFNDSAPLTLAIGDLDGIPGDEIVVGQENGIITKMAGDPNLTVLGTYTSPEGAVMDVEVVVLQHSLDEDLSYNGIVNFEDFVIFADEWFATGTLTADFIVDGIVDFLDLDAFGKQWLQTESWY